VTRRSWACMLSRFILLALFLFSAALKAQTATIAVAANFAPTAQKIADQLSRDSEFDYEIVVGATGLLVAQWRHGAPFDVLLAADRVRPQTLLEAGDVCTDCVKPYARGFLSLWIPRSPRPVFPEPDLAERDVRHLAIANARLAPYGVAARAVLDSPWGKEQSHVQIVEANDVGATYALVASGAAQAGLVALSSLRANRVPTDEFWTIDSRTYPAIEQWSVLLPQGEANPAARYWFEQMQLDSVRAIISDAGYGVFGG
jgi:molybdate transport system substrate-binding protein